MILVDTSVWIDHLRRDDPLLRNLLDQGQVLSHSFVIGELAMGNLKNRMEILETLSNLPGTTVAHHDEVLRFISDRTLFGHGIGYVDAHLLVSAQLNDASLWTRDRRLRDIADRLSLSFHGH